MNEFISEWRNSIAAVRMNMVGSSVDIGISPTLVEITFLMRGRKATL
jgi:hypothetical protein